MTILEESKLDQIRRNIRLTAQAMNIRESREIALANLKLRQIEKEIEMLIGESK